MNETRPSKLSIPLDPPPSSTPRLVHPTLWEVGNGVLGWRARNAIDFLVFVTTIGLMLSNGAPGWALIAIGFVATRSSRLEDAARAAALQSTEKVRLEAIEASVDKLTARIDKAMHRG
jgi:hypothetical protein